jgi:hypothetical protein
MSNLLSVIPRENIVFFNICSYAFWLWVFYLNTGAIIIILNICIWPSCGFSQTVVLFTYLPDCFLSMNWFSRQQILFCDIQNHLRHFRHTYSVMKLPCKMHVRKNDLRGFFCYYYYYYFIYKIR